MKSGNYSQASSQESLNVLAHYTQRKRRKKRRLALSEKPSDVEKRLLEFRRAKVEELLTSMTAMRVQKSGAI